MTGPRFYLLAGSFTAMLVFTMIAAGGEAVITAAPQSPALPPNHPVVTTMSPGDITTLRTSSPGNCET